MKTFRQYLISYICMLMIPVVALSGIFFSLTSRYYAGQIAKHNASMLQHISKSLELQTSQIDAYNYQTVQTPSFSTGKLTGEDISPLFEVRSYLNNWSLTSDFIADLYYTFTSTDKIYSGSSVYTPETFALYQLQGKCGAADIRDYLGGTSKAGWYSLGDTSDPILLYVSVARASYSEKHYLVARIDPARIADIVHDASEYPDAASFLCSANGQIMLSLGENSKEYLETVGDILLAEEDYGSAGKDGIDLIYSKAENNGLVYINVLPGKSAYEVYSRMVWMFSLGIIGIVLLGIIMGWFFMRVNYQPIRELGKLSNRVASDVCENEDVVRDALNTINLLQQSRYEMQDQSRLLNRETLIMKLLMGRYKDGNAFNKDAAEYGIALQGNSWKLLEVTGVDYSGDQDENVIACVAKVFGRENSRMRLFSPENASLLFVLPVEDENDVRPEKLRSELEMLGSDIRVMFGKRNTSTDEFVNELQELDRSTQSGQMDDMRMLVETLHNAIEFSESERIRLSLFRIHALLEKEYTADSARIECFKILQSIYSLHECQEKQATASQIRTELTEMLYDDQPDLNKIFHRLEEILTEAVESNDKQNEPILDKILAYLDENCCNEQFSIQDTAEHFDLTLSNMSHYFKKYAGVSVSDWVRRRRIEIAEKLLTDTEIPIAEIGEKVGYWQSASFTRAFRAVEGMSPVQYRKEHMEGNCKN